MKEIDEYVDYMLQTGYFSDYGHKGGKIYISNYTKSLDDITIYVTWGVGDNFAEVSLNTTMSELMSLQKIKREQKIKELLGDEN
jgi:hypothetical protein